MGQGPNNGDSRRPSTKVSIRERLAAGDGEGAGAGAATPMDPCVAERTVTVALHGARVTLGEPVHVIAGTPPLAATGAGVIGPLAGTAGKQIEACMRVGFDFAGEVVKAGSRSAVLVLRGQGGE